MEVIQLDEDSDDEIDKLGNENIINILSEESQSSQKDDDTLEILVQSDSEEEEVVCLDDSPTGSDNSPRDDSSVSEEVSELHIDSSDQPDLQQKSTNFIEKNDDNAVDVDLFNFEDVDIGSALIHTADNFTEDPDQFDDYRSETVDELREIVSSDEDEDSKFGDILSKQLISSSEQDVIRDLDFKMYGDQPFLSLESMKLLFHSEDKNLLDDLIRIVEREGLPVSGCLKFESWSLSHIGLRAVDLIRKNLILLARNEAASLFLRQIQPANCRVEMGERVVEVRGRNTEVGGKNVEVGEGKVEVRERNVEVRERNVEVRERNVEVGKRLDYDGDLNSGDVEVIEVKQNREMKRKGIKLPWGWKVLGIKTETELESQGQQHKCLKIDWKFKSPEGLVCHDLKTALKIVKKNQPKHEKWEILRNKEIKILEKVPAYVTLKQQFDDELDQALEKDVFSLSGIRPVRKFPENCNLEPKSKPKTKEKTVAPIRMSAALKSNPISLAQKEKMERKSGESVRRFKLTEVSEVQSSVPSEGWFSSKLLAIKFISSGNLGSLTPLPCLPASFLPPSPNKVQVKVPQETLEMMITDLVAHVKSPVSENLLSPSPPSPTPLRIPDFNHAGLKNYISPEGDVYSNIESVQITTNTPRKRHLHTPKKRKDPLTQNSAVIRKVSWVSPAKRAKREEDDDIDDLLLGSDTDEL